jgi:acyl-CoA synthetase (AMP-forming)/AMP-acid ligase II
MHSLKSGNSPLSFQAAAGFHHPCTERKSMFRSEIIRDVIIRGGDGISSLEIEDIISPHPEVLQAATVPPPDPVWGEVPKTATGKTIKAKLRSREWLGQKRQVSQ